MVLPSAPSSDESSSRVPTKNDYCVHHVQMHDSLNTLVIRYGVSKDVIRFANDFSGDEIYMFKKLVIPYSCKFHISKDSLVGPLMGGRQSSADEEEETKKKWKQSLMNEVLMKQYGTQRDYHAEARFYLEAANYNLIEAMNEFEADLEFEKEVQRQEREATKIKLF